MAPASSLDVLKGWGLLKVAAAELPATRHPRRGRQPNPWVKKARAELKKLRVDAATIAELLWVFHLAQRPPGLEIFPR